MTKTDFIHLIEYYQLYSKELDKWDELVPMFESTIIKLSEKIFNHILSLQFSKEGYDWITWWLWEKNGNPEMKAYDNKNEIPTETIEDLWNIVKKYIK